ncbi:MAG: FHA domain-containing protein [Parabacteroides sp.]|nr:FHA domain-containing protein [Parabacteroides sp.]
MIINIKREKTNEVITLSTNDNETSYVIGRSKECDFTISGNPMISRRHIEVSTRGSSFFVEDLGSKFETFLDDKKVTGPIEICPGQILKLADEFFIIEGNEFKIPSINSNKKVILCSICHSEIDVSDKFCPVCGNFIS